MLDEFAAVPNDQEVAASVKSVASCVIYNSTCRGVNNVFYTLRGLTSIRQMRVHWTLHPDKKKGLYRDADGKWRSPWYDREVLESPSLHIVRQEIDIDYSAYQSAFFKADLLGRMRDEDVQPPWHTGRLGHTLTDYSPTEFVPEENGPLKLWIHIGDGKPPRSRTYCVGADIATGNPNGIKSNSCLYVLDRNTLEQVAEYTVSGLLPHKFAWEAIALCKWFTGSDGNPAYLIWEHNGPGQSFGGTIIDEGFTNFYWREDTDTVQGKLSRRPGWWTSEKSKQLLLDEFNKGCAEKTHKIRSVDILEEMRQYVYNERGKPVHEASRCAEDGSDSGDNHGDRVIAAAVAWWAIHHMAEQSKPAEPTQPTYMSIAERVNEVQHRLRRTRYWCQSPRAWRQLQCA